MPQPTLLNKATGQWVHHAAITAPTGGTIVDDESRTAVGSVIAVLQAAGVVAGATHLPAGHQWNGTLKKIVLTGALTAPTGGTTTDADLRTAIGSVITVLEQAGLANGATTGPAFALDAAELQLAAGAAIDDLAVDGTGDDEARTALNACLAAMRLAELIA